MRYGVIGDVHGNLPALEASLAALSREGVDAVLCLGDLVGYGPFPNECVARIAALGAHVVAGNHDLMAVGRLEDRGSPLALQTMRWTRATLQDPARRYLATLPLERRAEAGVVLTHGALGDPSRYVRGSAEASAQLAGLRRDHDGARFLLLGHTHRPFAFGRRTGTRLLGGRGHVRLDARDTYLLNPGSVGQSRQWSAAARVLVLDTERSIADFLAVSYDARPVCDAVARHRLPPDPHHRRPPLWRAATGRRLRRRAAERLRGA